MAMTMARSSRASVNFLTRIAAACESRFAASPLSPSSSSSSSLPHENILLLSAPLPHIARAFASVPLRSAISIASCSSQSGMALIIRNVATSPPAAAPAAQGLSIIVQSYSKRPKKWQGVPHAFVQVEPGAPCPPYAPNAGSVKNRKHNKRMAQRHAFAKAQAQQRKEETKSAVIKRDALRRKRWREGAARARAWAKHLEEQKANAVSA